jgi:iron complex outermembrane recepter protein
VANFDLSKSITDKLFVAFGSEARTETYEIIAGDTASYSGAGSNSFPGIRAENARTNSRMNIGAYADVTYDITPNFLVAGAYRFEQYSDFGSASVGKLSSRLKLAEDKVVVRGSVSSGFRAPTLHQIYAQSTQASFAGGTIVNSGLFNNISKEAYLLGVPKLKAEKSTNITFGAGFNPNANLSISVDYYSINIKDRVVYSSSITTDDASTELYDILQAGNLSSVQFFINGIETQTNGIDVVGSYRNLAIGSSNLDVNLAGNFVTKNEIVGTPNDPDAIADAGATILNTQVKSLLTKGRPQYKAILGLDYTTGNFNVVLNNTLFGPTEFQDLDNDGDWFDARMDMNNIKQEFSPAVVTDLNFGYSFNKSLSASISINNIFDVLHTWELKALNSDGQEVLDDPQLKQLMEGFLEFSGRYHILGYNGSQFSQLGRTFSVQITCKF